MRYVILLLIGLTVGTLPAFADDSDDWPVCNTSEGNSAIAACTRILQRWEASGSDLSTAFNNRGLAYDNKGQLDLALADYNQAIRLEPESALVCHNRG
jgi:tetratricopeptide (TPR) repeat protein